MKIVGFEALQAKIEKCCRSHNGRRSPLLLCTHIIFSIHHPRKLVQIYGMNSVSRIWRRWPMMTADPTSNLAIMADASGTNDAETGVDLQSFIRLVTQSQTEPLVNGYLKFFLLPQQRGATRSPGSSVKLSGRSEACGSA
jgi:hypothetical protein